VVHMVGGAAALVGAVTVGPRIGRFNPDGTPNVIPGHSTVLVALGGLILWTGFYAFNVASNLVVSSRIGKVLSFPSSSL